MSSAGVLRVPPSDSEWSRAAHWAATDAKRAVVLQGVTYWWSATYSNHSQIGVAEIERRADGSWGDPVFIGDLVANEAIAARVRRHAADPSTAIISSGISHALGRDTDSSFAAWFGRPVLVAAREASRLVDLELAYIAAHGIQHGRRRYAESYGEHRRWSHTNDEPGTLNRAKAWIDVAALLAARVTAYREGAGRRLRSLNADLETRVADDRAAMEAIARYSERLAGRVSRLSSANYSLNLPDSEELDDLVRDVRIAADPPTPATESMSRLYSRTNSMASRVAGGVSTYRTETVSMRADLAACEGAIALLSEKPRGGRPIAREASTHIATAADQIWNLPKRRSVEHIERAIAELLTTVAELRERASTAGADRRTAWSADLVAEEIEAIAACLDSVIEGYHEAIGMAETLDEALVGRFHALGRELGARFPEPARAA